MGKTIHNKPLSAVELDAFGRELDQIRADTVAQLGQADVDHMRRMIRLMRGSEIAGRSLLFLGFLPPAWLAGTALLSLSKILDNMEVGHNVMHGQYEWTRDPALKGSYEWDTACPGDAWRHSHNYMHHTFTNVVGKDRDVGYGILRMADDQRWHPGFLLQPIYAALLATFFQWGVALHDLELDYARRGKKTWRAVWRDFKPVLRKGGRQIAKDYLLFPLLAGPMFLPVLAGNVVANLVRNLWAFSIIFCGHFTEHAEMFDASIVDEETRGHWYLRQLRGSSNLEGNRAFHILTGHLSHQIEHHLYPDVPAARYPEMAERVREVCQRYGQHYNTGGFWPQFGTVWARIFRLALPGSGGKQPAYA